LGCVGRDEQESYRRVYPTLLGEDSRKFGNIQGRIDAVASRGLITPDLKDWAHQIRLAGNEATHDHAPYSEEEASELLDFTELYLTYVYTLPKRLELRKAKNRAARTAKSPGVSPTQFRKRGTLPC
jgi:uncharacterized protein DUF4145